MRFSAKSLTLLRLCFLIELSRRRARIIFMRMQGKYQIKNNARLLCGAGNLSCLDGAGCGSVMPERQLINTEE
jgi:hypothetical protein